jgi:hypothetical protein
LNSALKWHSLTYFSLGLKGFALKVDLEVNAHADSINRMILLGILFGNKIFRKF